MASDAMNPKAHYTDAVRPGSVAVRGVPEDTGAETTREKTDDTVRRKTRTKHMSQENGFSSKLTRLSR